MSIEDAPHCLVWGGSDEIWLAAYREFLALASDRLGHLMRMLQDLAPARAEILQSLLSVASDRVYTRLITAPEVTNRLLWSSPSVENANFIIDVLQAELVAAGILTKTTGQPLWAALGDFVVTPAGDARYSLRIDEFMPIDIGSPFAETMAKGEGFVDAGTPETRAFATDECERIAGILKRTREALEATSEEAFHFVLTFNRVLILQKDLGAPETFASGSTGQYIGRSFIANPHLAFVDESQLADAIVHEAIHGFLYMLEIRVPWVFDRELYEPTPVIYSPWTGNHLALRPFLQACFVWFGLAHFFAIALSRGTLPPRRAKDRLRLAVTGFLKGDLLLHLEAYRERVAPAIVTAIQEMQARVLAAYSVVA